MLINSLVENPHCVEMIRLVEVNKAFHTFQKASLSEKLGLQLHRIEQYYSNVSSNAAILLVSGIYGSPMLTRKIVANVTKFQASSLLSFLKEAACFSCYGVGFACASGSDPALLSGWICPWLTQCHLDYKLVP